MTGPLHCQESDLLHFLPSMQKTGRMNVEAVSRSNATLTLSAEELVLLFGCTVEATEALSASEFHARVGQAEAEAERLGSQLKETLAEMSRLDMPNDV